MEVNLTTEVRQKVVDWVNSKSKDFATGLELLKLTGYKPHVYAIFNANRNRKDIPAKVEQELRLFLRYYANPSNPIHTDQVPNFFQTHEPKQENLEVAFDKNGTDGVQYPDVIKKAIAEHSDLYKQRSMLHAQLKSHGEDNSETATKKRSKDLLVIEACSRRMDQLWHAIDSFKANGFLPDADLFKTPFDPVKAVAKAAPKTTEPTLALAGDLVGLKKQSENWRIKISKAENRLNYQQDKKADKAKPMPEGPKRILLVKRITKLKAEKGVIDIALANMK